MTAPDLSEHFGWVGELIIGLIGLLLLSLMHKDVRQAGRKLLKKSAAGIKGLHYGVYSRHKVYARWNDAFQLIFRQKRDLLLILAALVIFDHAVSYYYYLIRELLILPLHESLSWDDPKIIQLSYLHAYSSSLLTCLGYALFGWLIYQRAQGENYKQAQSFRPLSKAVAFGLCLAGAETLTKTIYPWLLINLSWLKEPMVMGWVAGGVVLGLLLFGAGARFLLSAHQQKNAWTALCVYFALTQSLQWFYYLLSLPGQPYEMWMRIAEQHLSQFTYIALWDITLTCFIVVIAFSAQTKTNPALRDYGLSNSPANAV